MDHNRLSTKPARRTAMQAVLELFEAIGDVRLGQTITGIYTANDVSDYAKEIGFSRNLERVFSNGRHHNLNGENANGQPVHFMHPTKESAAANGLIFAREILANHDFDMECMRREPAVRGALKMALLDAGNYMLKIEPKESDDGLYHYTILRCNDTALGALMHVMHGKVLSTADSPETIAEVVVDPNGTNFPKIVAHIYDEALSHFIHQIRPDVDVQEVLFTGNRKRRTPDPT